MQHDDPTLREVLGQMSTPETYQHNNGRETEERKSQFRGSVDTDPGSYKVNRQLIKEYKGSNDSDTNISMSLLHQVEETQPDKDNVDEQKLTMSMLTKDQLCSSRFGAEPEKNSNYNKLQCDLNSLQAKIQKLESKLKTKPKRKHLDDTEESQAFQSLNQEPSYEFTSSDAKALTFNNEKGELSNTFHNSLMSSGKKKASHSRKRNNYMQPTSSSKNRSFSHK